MSIHFHTYVGPVLICKYHYNDVVSTKTVKVNRCTNGHRDKGKAKFCPQCGQPFSTYEETKESTKREVSVGSIYDILDEGGFREDLFDECWGGLNNEELVESAKVFSPSNKFLDRDTNLDCREFTLHHLGNLDTKAEIAKCEEKYAKEIAYLRTKYDSVTVDWAIVTNGR